MIESILIRLAENKEGIETAISIAKYAGSVFAFLGGIITAIFGFYKFYNERKGKQLSDFIERFSASDEKKRLSGINGISRYSKTLFKELFFICSVEKDTIIKELIYDALQKQSDHMINSCIQINGFLVDYILKYKCQGDLFNSIINDEKLKNTLVHSQTKRRIRYETNKKSSSIFEEDISIDDQLLLSSRLLASALSKSVNIKLNGCLIIQSDLYMSKLTGDIFDHCIFIDNINRHMSSLFTKYEHCFIRKINHYDSKFSRTNFVNCVIEQKTSFRKSHLTQVLFRGGRMNDVTFSESDINRCRYEQINEIKTCSWNVCNIDHSRFTKIKIIASRMYDIKIVATHFTDVDFYRNKILGTIKNCHFHNVAWGGTELVNVDFQNCIFKNVDFTGIVSKKYKFTNCRFINTNLRNLEKNDTNFIHCTFTT